MTVSISSQFTAALGTTGQFIRINRGSSYSLIFLAYRREQELVLLKALIYTTITWLGCSVHVFLCCQESVGFWTRFSGAHRVLPVQGVPPEQMACPITLLCSHLSVLVLPALLKRILWQKKTQSYLKKWLKEAKKSNFFVMVRWSKSKHLYIHVTQKKIFLMTKEF